MRHKLLFLFALFLTTGIVAQDNPVNMACFRDTALIDQEIYRKDTTWQVKSAFRKGDWNIYYDFAMTRIRYEWHFTDKGEKTGTWKEFFSNGKLKAQWEYTSAWVPLYPPGKEWYSNGVVKIDREQKNDTLYEVQYFQGGKVKQNNKWIKNGLWVYTKQFCENGQVIIEYNPTSDTPKPVKKYHCNGMTLAEYNWYAFGYTGVYKEYHSNGKIAIQGQYTEKPANQAVYMARKTGTWIFYDEKGKVTKKETWENGRLTKTEK